jgi:hypothetical protein
MKNTNKENPFNSFELSENPVLHLDDYAEAVEKLLKLAKRGTGGGCVAAQVLLSCYNGNEWQLNITSLSSLDDGHYHAAMTVIDGRRRYKEEPHTCIVNGDQIFAELWDQWKRYHIQNRHKKECIECFGTGQRYIDERDDDNHETEPCSRCQETGLVSL